MVQEELNQDFILMISFELNISVFYKYTYIHVYKLNVHKLNVYKLNIYIYPPIYNINVKKFCPNSDGILVTSCRLFIIETPKNLGENRYFIDNIITHQVQIIRARIRLHIQCTKTKQK